MAEAEKIILEVREGHGEGSDDLSPRLEAIVRRATSVAYHSMYDHQCTGFNHP
jgi:hypothetical protein